MTLTIIFGVGVLFLLTLAGLAFFLSRNTTRLNRIEPDGSEFASLELSRSQREHLLELVRQRKNIEAIKEYRLITGSSLKAAKNAIDRLSLDS
ncbi:hypothetical protein [Synechococcus sp. PCC 6312]|uniref:hypothetical protein n=1 Tax=Synechococcus sp. (strain ATCC 27167 / PCC 6312) TaxID=195253 RepID=UPI00029ECD21|nr:hypothetical protein [Synechococcus sp. PCC 6312]AFY61531.1 LSU ribosomal protein L12P-like protein [Synechococcus sp. PCC 6312]